MTTGSGGGASGSGIGGGRSPFPKVIDDRFHVRRRLGRGGQGAVYLAYDAILDIEVAIKTLEGEVHTEEFRKKLRDEARLLAKLKHPNIVELRDCNPSFPYLVMEYCDGGDLTTLLKRRPRMTVLELLGIARQIATGLATAHQNAPRPIIHRDLKPGNVLFHQGVPKVCDFGLGKMMGVQTGVTTTRGMMGTVSYFSPEQSRDISGTDHRTDIWALGVVLYEMLTWTRPFDRQGDDNADIILRLRTEEPRPPPFPLPKPIAEVIEVALRKRPEERFATAREMGAAIDAALAAMPDADRSYSPPLERRTELDHLASFCADCIDQGDEGQARQLLAQMRELAPDASLTRFWSKRSSDLRTSRPSAAGSAAVSAPSHHFGGGPTTEDRIRSLIRDGDFRRARDLIGEILSQDKTNPDAIRLLGELEAAEREYREEIDEAYKQAERAFTAGDSKAVLRIWRNLAEKFPSSQSVKNELAIAEVQVQQAEQKRARAGAERDAAAKEAEEDFSGALNIWNAHIAKFPEDTSAEAERQRLEAAVGKREVERQRAATRAEFEKRRAEGDDAGELAALRDYLAVAPYDREAIKRASELVLKGETAQRTAERAATRDAVETLAARQDYGAALAAWRRYLAAWPDDADARAQAVRFEHLVAQEEGQAATAVLEDLVTRVSRRLESGRFRSLPEHERIVATLLARAGGAGRECSPVLVALRDELSAAYNEAESRVAASLAAQIGPLCEHAVAARHTLGDHEPTGNSHDPARDALELALVEAVEALAGTDGGDPIAALVRGDQRLVDALAAHEQARLAAEEEERRRVAQQAEGVRGLVRRAVELEACNDPGTPSTAIQALEGEIQRVLAPGGVPREATRLLSSIALRAEARQFLAGAQLLAYVREQAIAGIVEAMERGDGVLFDRAKKLLQAQASTDVLQPALATELIRAARVLGERRQVSSAAPSPPGAEALRWQRARERWDEPGPAPDPQAGSEARAAIKKGDEARARGDLPGMTEAAERLEAAARRRERAVLGERHAAVLAELDGSRFAGATSWVAELRRALAAGNSARIEQLIGSAPAPGAGPRAEQEGRPRPVDARTRAHNERFNARALRRYDEMLKEGADGGNASELVRAREALVEPPPRWPWWAAAAGATIGAALLTLRLLGPDEPSVTFPITFATIGRSVEISSLTTEDGRPIPVAPATIADGATISLAEGEYRLERRGEPAIQFKVPQEGTVVLAPNQGGNLDTAITSALEPPAVAPSGNGR